MMNRRLGSAVPNPQPANEARSPAPQTTAMPTPLHRLLLRINTAPDAEAMQQLIQMPDLLEAAVDILRGIGVRTAHQVRPKMLLSAMLICKFPEALFGQEPTQEEENLIIMARVLHECLMGHVEGQIVAEECLRAFLTYKSTFEAWQQADRPALIDSLIARYMDLENATASLDSKFAQQQQQPQQQQPTAQFDSLRQNINDMQQQIREKLERVGGVKAMARLEEAIVRRDPVAAVHMEVPAVPVAALVHELCFNRHFELIKLIEEYNGVPKEAEVVMAGDEDTLRLMQYLQEDLLPIIPTGTCMELQKHLDRDVVARAIETRQFNLQSALHLAVNVMAQSCAPIRDGDVQSVRTMLESGDTDKAVSHMIRVIDLMRLDFYAYALCQQRPVLLNSIVEYERNYFAGQSFEKARLFVRAHPDWSEWPFLPEFQEIESVQLDRRRVQGWRHSLNAIIMETAFDILQRRNPNIQKASVTESNSVVKLLRKRVQAAIKECVGLRTKEQLRKDGFTIKDSVILHDTLAEIQHFMRLHLAIHKERYEKIE